MAETGRSCWGRGQQDASGSEADAGSRNPGSVTEGDGEGLRQQIPIIPAVHLPAADDFKAAGQGVVQAVLIFRADGGPDAHDPRTEQGKRHFQQLPLQTVAPVVGVDDGAVGVGPAVPLFSRDAHKGRVVVRVLPAVPQDEVGPQPPAVPPADAQVLFQVTGDVFQRVGYELLRVRHRGPHLVLQGVKGGGILRPGSAQGHGAASGPAAHFVQKNFHSCSIPPK